MAAYLEASLEESDGDATFVARALGDIARAKGMSQVARDGDCRAKAFTRLCPVREARTSRPFCAS